MPIPFISSGRMFVTWKNTIHHFQAGQVKGMGNGDLLQGLVFI